MTYEGSMAENKYRAITLLAQVVISLNKYRYMVMIHIHILLVYCLYVTTKQLASISCIWIIREKFIVDLNHAKVETMKYKTNQSGFLECSENVLIGKRLFRFRSMLVIFRVFSRT